MHHPSSPMELLIYGIIVIEELPRLLGIFGSATPTPTLTPTPLDSRLASAEMLVELLPRYLGRVRQSGFKDGHFPGQVPFTSACCVSVLEHVITLGKFLEAPEVQI